MKILKRSRKYPGVFQYENKRGKFWGYRIKYYDASNKRREKKQVSFPTERDAFEAMVEMQNNINKENYHQVNPSKMTLGELIDMIIEQNKPNENGTGVWSNNTYYQYDSLRRNWIKGTIDHIPIKDLTLEVYQNLFINHHRNEHPTSILNYHKRLNAFINEAVRRDYIASNRIKHAKLPQLNEEVEDRFITVEELKLLLQHADDLKVQYRTLFYLFAYTGMRVGEMRALTWNDVDFEACTVNISKSIDNKNKLGPTKGRNKRRIEVNEGVIRKLKAFKKSKMAENKFGHNKEYIFNNPRLGLPIYQSTIDKNLKKLSKKSIGMEISSHYFRHTHASILLMSGQPVKVVAKRLGNTEQTIIKHYSHIIPGISTPPAEAFDEKLESGANSGARNIITLD